MSGPKSSSYTLTYEQRQRILEEQRRQREIEEERRRCEAEKTRVCFLIRSNCILCKLNANTTKMDESEEPRCQLIKPGSNAAILLQLVEEAFNQMPFLV